MVSSPELGRGQTLRFLMLKVIYFIEWHTGGRIGQHSRCARGVWNVRARPHVHGISERK